MSPSAEPAPWLLLETSGRAGVVGLAVAGAVVSRQLDGTKRHNRDLIPLCAEVLDAAGFSARQLGGVMVGIGPGSYTGLRVGLTAAKGFALAAGCQLVAVPTFAVLAAQAPAEWPTADVISDALKGMVYHQRFGAAGATGIRTAESELRILRFDSWKISLTPRYGITGPGADQFRDHLTGHPVPPSDQCHPRADALHRVGRAVPPLTRPEWFALEPLYLRGSSAEEKANATP